MLTCATLLNTWYSLSILLEVDMNDLFFRRFNPYLVDYQRNAPSLRLISARFGGDFHI